MGSGWEKINRSSKLGTGQTAFPDFLTRRIFAKQLAL
jgi:hypothetical protein